MNPQDDGITHINTYSKGKTELGRFLSNFYHYPDGRMMTTEDGDFRTIEGYWYWLSVRDDRLRSTTGFESKKLGRELRGVDWIKDPDFYRRIGFAIVCKILNDPEMSGKLRESTLPLVHYYVYNSQVLEVKEVSWIMALMDHVRNELRG